MRVSLEKEGKTFLGFDQTAAAKLQAAMLAARLLHRNAELIPQFTDKYIVAFDIPAADSYETYAQWMTSQSTLTMKIFDITVETDQAGNPTKKARFEIPVVVRSFKDTYLVKDGTQQRVRTEEVSK